MRTRTQLGHIIGRCLKVWDDIENDPISAHYGITIDPAPAVIKELDAAGWTWEELERQLKARGISNRYIYFSGIGMIIDVARLDTHRTRRRYT